MKSFRQFAEDTHHIYQYGDWGWIDAKGKAIMGHSTPGVNMHIALAQKAGMRDAVDALRHGWIRWFINNDTDWDGNRDRQLVFDFQATPTTVTRIHNFVKKYPIPMDHYTAEIYGTSDKPVFYRQEEDAGRLLTYVHSFIQPLLRKSAA